MRHPPPPPPLRTYKDNDDGGCGEDDREIIKGGEKWEDPLWSVRDIARIPAAVAAHCASCCQPLHPHCPALDTAIINVLAFVVVALSLYDATDFALRGRDELER
jgi:hypothetical protein